MLNIQAELAKHIAFRERLLAEYPEVAEEDLADTLQGATNLDEALIAAIRQAHADECAIEAIEMQIERLKSRANRLQRRADYLRQRVAEAMEAAGMKKLPAPDFTASLRPTPPKVIVTDEASIPADYFVQPPPKLDKRLVAQALKDGHTVPGCALSNGGVTLSIRVL